MFTFLSKLERRDSGETYILHLGRKSKHLWNYFTFGSHPKRSFLLLGGEEISLEVKTGRRLSLLQNLKIQLKKKGQKQIMLYQVTWVCSLANFVLYMQHKAENREHFSNILMQYLGEKFSRYG